MGEFMGAVLRGAASYRRTWTPRVDVYETPREFIVVADIAGVQPSAVTVEVDDTEIVISGNRNIPLPDDAECKHAYAMQLEIPSGAFERRLNLPTRVDPDNSAADFFNGMLVIRFPKAARRRTRVEVNDS